MCSGYVLMKKLPLLLFPTPKYPFFWMHFLSTSVKFLVVNFLSISSAFNGAALRTGKPLVMNSKRKIVIIASNPLLTALQTLIQSAPTLDQLAAGVSLSAVCGKIDNKPDIVVTYLDRGRSPNDSEALWSKKIEDLKSIWPGVYIIAIISDPKRREEIRLSGADKVLFDGITPARLLAIIETVELQSNV